MLSDRGDEGERGGGHGGLNWSYLRERRGSGSVTCCPAPAEPVAMSIPAMRLAQARVNKWKTRTGVCHAPPTGHTCAKRGKWRRT